MKGARVAPDLQSQSSFFSGMASKFRCGSEAWFEKGVQIIVANSDPNGTGLFIGDRVYINHYSIIDCHSEIIIGNRVLIGPHVYIGDFDHDFGANPGASIGPPRIFGRVHIHNDVWIGANAVILKGVQVGVGAVIGAGSVVTRDVPSMTVVAGSPARRIGQRKSLTSTA